MAPVKSFVNKFFMRGYHILITQLEMNKKAVRIPQYKNLAKHMVGVLMKQDEAEKMLKYYRILYLITV